MLRLFVWVAALLASASTTLVVHDSRNTVPAGFDQGLVPDGAEMLTLRIGLVPANRSKFEDIALSVSDRRSASYGQYLTAAELSELVGPTNGTSGLITNWLVANNVTFSSTSPLGNMLKLRLSVQQANQMFGALFLEYRHIASGQKAIRTLSYSVPLALKAHIGFIHPTTNFDFAPKPTGQAVNTRTNNSTILSRASLVSSSCDDITSLSCIQALYGVPLNAQVVVPGNLLWVMTNDQSPVYLNDNDVQEFLVETRAGLALGPPLVPILDENAEITSEMFDGATMIPTLATEYTAALTGKRAQLFIGDSNQGFLNPIMNMIDAIMNTNNKPTVVVIPSGIAESIGTTIAGMSIVCDALGGLGTMGKPGFCLLLFSNFE
ncbi:Family S53 protease-like protein [Mycena indigotica]|uniref:Family S53 protease-like protein n=1 Tax=Mycena indigotica TaxID=2126181 RepID=A0A8H6WJU7_9AGAR|nr:Family S53 protease-like protein [Mycena indigotica]KAF7314919.1 Family S53 protease-like protein [Mycena indigotica]